MCDFPQLPGFFPEVLEFRATEITIHRVTRGFLVSISDVCPLLAFVGILYHPDKFFLIISIVVTAVVTTWDRIMRTAAQISGFNGILDMTCSPA